MKNATLPLLVAVYLAGCQSRAWPDVWLPIEVPKGSALHNKSHQQTAFDTDHDGRIDRLRFWMGSGVAEELVDVDLDGWFDEYLTIVYEKKRESSPIHMKAPSFPVSNTSGSFDRKILIDLRNED